MNKDFTVVLVYPDYLAENYGTDTYTAYVEAGGVDAAITQAKEQAAKANQGECKGPDDFAPVFVCEGKVQNICPM